MQNTPWRDTQTYSNPDKGYLKWLSMDCSNWKMWCIWIKLHKSQQQVSFFLYSKWKFLYLSIHGRFKNKHSWQAFRRGYFLHFLFFTVEWGFSKGNKMPQPWGWHWFVGAVRNHSLKWVTCNKRYHFCVQAIWLSLQLFGVV